MAIILDTVDQLCIRLENLEKEVTILKSRVGVCPMCEEGKVGWYSKYGVNPGNEWEKDDGHVDGVCIKDGDLWYDNSGGEYDRDRIKINYCPICGRKL